jgi:hypothetical protein
MQFRKENVLRIYLDTECVEWRVALYFNHRVFDGLHLSVGQIPYISGFLFPGIRRMSSHPISNQLKE